MSFSSDTTKHRHTLLRKCKTSRSYSTPILGVAGSPSSISASAIDTNSSSSPTSKVKRRDRGKEWSGRKKLQKERLGEILKKEKLKEKLKKEKLAKKLEEERLGQKKRTDRVETRRKKRDKREKKKLIEKRESEYNWETCDESSRQSPEVGKNCLFEDIPSPEHIRDANRITSDPLYSPILRPCKFPTAIADSPKGIASEEQVRRLHVKDLAFSFGFGDSDEEEDELILNRQSNGKTYPPKKKERARKKSIGIDKSKTWLVDVAVPTASSDHLWNDFVEKNHEKCSKYLARPGNHERKNSNVKEKVINNAKGDFSGLRDNWSEETNLRLSKLGKEMAVERGYYEKSSRTFVNAEDVYDFIGKKDNELDKNDGTTERMTLHQFRQKRRAQKRKVIELDSSSSSPICQLDAEKTFRISRHPPHKEKVEKKIPRGNLKSASRKLKTTMADVARLELQRINDVRRFASRLNERKKAMISNETSLPSTSKNDESSSTVSSLERIYRDDIDGRQVENKRLSSTKRKGVPTIKSIESLRTVRFERNKQNWRLK